MGFVVCYSTVISLTSIYLIIQIIVAVFLLVKMIKIKRYSFLPLILFFFLNVHEAIFILFEDIYIYQQIFVFLSNISLVIFTKSTFYKDRKSNFVFLFGAIVTLKVIDFVLELFVPFSTIGGIELSSSEIAFHYIFVSIMCVVLLISYGWLAYASFSYYKLIQGYDIMPWVKKRYLLLGVSSLIISLNGFIYLFFPINAKSFEEIQAFIMGVLILINIVVFSLGNLICWLMPKTLKEFFNRNYTETQEEDLPEKELLDKIKSQLAGGD